MQRPSPSSLVTLALLLVAGLVASCASKPARFYTLSPLPVAERAGGQPASRVVVSVEPVEIPDYLDRPQIMTREGGNELKLAEFDRWGGSLGENISAVLAEDLAQQLGSDHVFANPGPPFEKPDYLVALRITRLDLVPGSQVFLKSQWKVTSAGTKRSMSQVSQVTERVAGKGYDALVTALNRAVAQVSGEMARIIAADLSAAPPPAATPAVPEAGRVTQ
jgi:uncharacterized protein